MNLFLLLFYCSGFIIFWAMIGYPVSLKVIAKLNKKSELIKDYSHKPTVTVMVVAHNEEKVILEKLNNLLTLDYPRENIQFLVASDNSTDKTNEIVNHFIQTHKEANIRLFEVKERKGKTNAQNEAQKTVTTEYLVMTDANSIIEKDAITELMAAFSAPNISYVSGRLSIINSDAADVSKAETNYWDTDISMREIEGRIQNITAGNGALYACKNEDYVDFNPIECHDSAMPTYYALRGKRAIANHDAIAYEKAGEVIDDEFGRKVRMNRIILRYILPDLRLLNIFKYKWYSYFYFGHRTSRYLLWISHLILLIANSFLLEYSLIYVLTMAFQLLFYTIALFGQFMDLKNKYVTMIYYYTITIVAQWVGVFRIITGKAKPFWEKAESTR